GRLEYDLMVSPGADVSRVRLAYDGVDSVKIDSEGNVHLASAGREVLQPRPRVYQLSGGARREVACRYALAGGRTVGLVLGGYDRRAELVVDPVLIYSTLVGGTG